MDGQSRDEKRLKIEPVESDNDNIVDIASLVQQAEASVMQELMPEPQPDPEPDPEPVSVSEPMPEPENHDISQDILDVINRTQAKLGSHENDNAYDYGSYGDSGNDISQDILNAISQTQVKPDADYDDDGISQEILDAINEATNHESLNQQTGHQSEDEKDLPDTIWGSPNHYTRRKHIIPALGNLVGSARRVPLTRSGLIELLGC